MSDSEHLPLSQMLRHRRKQLGLTLEALADKVDLTPGALSHIESGRRLPDSRNAVRIAHALGLSEEDVLQSLDEAHALRRRSSAYQSQSASLPVGPPPSAAAASSMPRGVQFSEMPIGRLFRKSTPEPSTESARNLARWSDDTSTRIEAIDRLADTAADAIRTLRGLVDDEDPQVQREARRLLRELDVRMPEE